MSFSFNFGVTENDAVIDQQHQRRAQHQHYPAQQNEIEIRNSSFAWLYDEEKNTSDSEVVSILQGRSLHSDDDNNNNELRHNENDDKEDEYVLRVHEGSSSFQNTNTDLISGIYEGGLKVWECSMDLFRYFCNHEEKIAVKGHILEIGCGHAIPSIWILKNSILKSKNCYQNNLIKANDVTNNNDNDNDNDNDDCFVTFADYNDFVIRDVTMRNVALNVKDAYSKMTRQPEECNSWIAKHCAFGAGDWLAMSDDLLHHKVSKRPEPLAIPKDGVFDCIIATETNYSESSAMETANILAKHLKPGTGVAYISTKRYYFGVGGGTKCFCDALQQNNNANHKYHIEILQELDNGVGNIRDLLLVKSLNL